VVGNSEFIGGVMLSTILLLGWRQFSSGIGVERRQVPWGSAAADRGLRPRRFGGGATTSAVGVDATASCDRRLV